jgi:hypothetical protein
MILRDHKEAHWRIPDGNPAMILVAGSQWGRKRCLDMSHPDQAAAMEKPCKRRKL